MKTVPKAIIEDLVGAKRHPTRHIANADSSEEVCYILHSEECRKSREDLLECPESKALAENGIDRVIWKDRTDRSVYVTSTAGILLPEEDVHS